MEAWRDPTVVGQKVMLMVIVTAVTYGQAKGDKWIYTFDVVQSVPQLIEHRGGNVSFVKSLEDHFDGGHNQHTNEVFINLNLSKPVIS